uniref:Uncharacterized protein n=1 Tax=Panagrellus redivivus TaxID=6233 RepID=A0A7E4UWP0_PANRE
MNKWIDGRTPEKIRVVGSEGHETAGRPPSFPAAMPARPRENRMDGRKEGLDCLEPKTAWLGLWRFLPSGNGRKRNEGKWRTPRPCGNSRAKWWGENATSERTNGDEDVTAKTLDKDAGVAPNGPQAMMMGMMPD